jgi:ethanolamine utilization protein EutN
MELARVVGQAMATVKDGGLRASKLLIVVPCGPDGAGEGERYVAVDTVGAGEHEVVLVARGSAARATERTRDAPTDAAIVGILDSVAMGGETTYRKD